MSAALPAVIEAHIAAASLPDPLIMTSCFSLRDGKIITLSVIFVPPADAAMPA